MVELLSDSEDDEPQTHGKSKTAASKKSTNGTAAKKATARVGIKLSAQRIDALLMGKGKPKKTAARGCKKKAGKGASSDEPPKVKRPDTKVLASFKDDRYVDLEEKEDTRKGGARIEPVLLKVSALYVDRDEPDPANAASRVRCIASRGCGTTWACPRNKSRILDHASGCSWLPVDLRQAAEDVLALEAIKKKRASKQQKPENRKRGQSGVLSDSDEDQPDPKQPRLDTVTSTQTKLDFARFLKKGETDLNQRGNDALVLLVTSCGLPSSMLDSPFFKDFVAAIQPKYRPPSSTKFRDRLVPQEAARLRTELVQQLKDVRDLTLGFDGGKVRKPRGIYTVTVTTPDRESFLADLNDASGVSHTSKYISTEVLEVVSGF